MFSFQIIKNNVKRSWNRKVGFIINLTIPLAVVVLGIFANNISKPHFTIGIINGEQSPYMAKALSNTTDLTVTTANKDKIQFDLITGKYSAIIEFSSSGYKLNSIKDEKTNSQIQKLIQHYQTNQTPIQISEILDTQMSFAKRITAFLTMFLMITATVMSSLLIKDKNSGTLKRYKYSPQNTTTYIIGNFLYTYLITLSQFLIAITVTQVLQLHFGIHYVDLILIGIWLSGLATAYGTLFASLFQKEMYANLFATLTALILSLIGGTFISYDNMPTELQKISVISPLRWFIDITKNLEQGKSFFYSTLPIIIITSMIIFCLGIAIIRNKKQHVL